MRKKESEWSDYFTNCCWDFQAQLPGGFLPRMVGKREAVQGMTVVRIKMRNLEENGLQQQKIRLGATPAIQEKKRESVSHTCSPKL